MTTRQLAVRTVMLVGGLLVLCAASWCAASAAATLQPRQQADLAGHTVFAYRQWQSTGLYLNTGDQVEIRAQGQWSYSPVIGLHGPAGGGRMAPAYYPLPSAQGGALLAKVGEAGRVFFVGGRRAIFVADRAGLLYLGINDDLLGDNVGQLSIDIQVIRPTATPAP